MHAIQASKQEKARNQPLEQTDLGRLVEYVRFAMVQGDKPGPVAESMLKRWSTEDYMPYWIALTAKGFVLNVAELPGDGELNTEALAKAALAQYVAQALAEEPLAS